MIGLPPLASTATSGTTRIAAARARIARRPHGQARWGGVTGGAGAALGAAPVIGVLLTPDYSIPAPNPHPHRRFVLTAEAQRAQRFGYRRAINKHSFQNCHSDR